MNITDRILTIIEDLLRLINDKESLTYVCKLWGHDICSPITLSSHTQDDYQDDDEIEEEWEEITEHVKDYSPNTLKEENEHLKNLIDLICETFWFEKYVTEKWSLWIAWDKWLLEEIAKARKKLGK